MCGISSVGQSHTVTATDDKMKRISSSLDRRKVESRESTPEDGEITTETSSDNSDREAPRTKSSKRAAEETVRAMSAKQSSIRTMFRTEEVSVVCFLILAAAY